MGSAQAGSSATGSAVVDNRVLIVKMSSIGDVAHALPIARILKQQKPGVFIGWVVRKRCADLLAGNPDVDCVYVLPDKQKLSDIWKLRSELRRDRYDVAADLQGLLLSGLIAWLSGARRRIGLDLNREGNRIFLNEPVVPAKAARNRHAIDILRGFLPPLGIDAGTPWPHVDYLASGQALPDELQESRAGKARVALNIGASSIYKQWPQERWAELAAMLVEQGYTPILIGGPQDVTSADEIARRSGVADDLIVLAGKTTLRGTAAVLKECDLLVSADTGPLHIAAAIGTPVVALFGPTNPVKTGPYGDNNRVIWKRLACSPCFRQPVCEGRVDCMKSISSREVLAAVQEMLVEKRVAAC